MAQAEKEYQRLPGRGLRRESYLSVVPIRSTLWLGKDHLLCLDSLGGYSEDYKRFYYQDIQAIIVRQTNRREILNLGLGLFGGLFSLIAWLAGDIWVWILGGLASVCFFGLLINWLRGPTCVCHLRTAVQTEQLPSLNRLSTTRKAIARLRPLIAATQGGLSPEEVRAQMYPNRES